MKLIDTKKVKDLLKKHNKTQRALSTFLGIPPSGLNESLNKTRPLSMNYVFDIAEFFDVEAKSLTVENDTKTTKTKSNPEKNKKV